MSKDNDALITALLFVNEDSGSLVIHFNGFQDSDHMDKFANKILKKIGIDYHKIDEKLSFTFLDDYGYRRRREMSFKIEEKSILDIYHSDFECSKCS